MEYCFDSLKSRVRMSLTVIGFIVLGLIFSVALVYVIYSIVNEETKNLLIIMIGVALGGPIAAQSGLWYWLGYRYYFVYSRKFSLDVNGIQLTYCNSKTVFCPWDDVGDVSVCDVNQNYGGGFDVVIRVGLNTERSGPLNPAKSVAFNGFDRWRDGWYLFSNYKKVIYLEYSDSRFECLQQICKREIIDRRTKLGESYTVKFWDKKNEDDSLV